MATLFVDVSSSLSAPVRTFYGTNAADACAWVWAFCFSERDAQIVSGNPAAQDDPPSGLLLITPLPLAPMTTCKQIPFFKLLSIFFAWLEGALGMPLAFRACRCIPDQMFVPMRA